MGALNIAIFKKLVTPDILDVSFFHVSGRDLEKF